MKARNAKPSELAIHIHKTYGQLEQHTRSAVQKALRLGDLLLAAKAAVAHGKFGKWVERQVERYMTLARERGVAEQLGLGRLRASAADQCVPNDARPEGFHD